MPVYICKKKPPKNIYLRRGGGGGYAAEKYFVPTPHDCFYCAPITENHRQPPAVGPTAFGHLRWGQLPSARRAGGVASHLPLEKREGWGTLSCGWSRFQNVRVRHTPRNAFLWRGDGVTSVPFIKRLNDETPLHPFLSVRIILSEQPVVYLRA